MTDVQTRDDAAAADLPLVRRAQAGDTAAFGELVERHRRAVFRAALAALGSAADAEDVAQDAFVAAWAKLAGFRGDAAFRTWLLTIAWRKALDRRTSVTRWMRRLTSGHGDDPDFDPIEHVADGARGQDEDLEGAELQRALRGLIAGLPRKLRDTLLLAGSGEHSYGQIAAILGVPLGTVKWRVSEARKVLRQRLAAKGYGDVV